jgi:signal transduction histidine kinase
MLTLADYCAQALERARLYDLEQQTRLVAEKTAARIERLQAMTAALAQAMTVEEVARIMVDQGTSALGAANGVVQLLDEQGTAFRLIHNAVSRLSSDELQSWQEYPADPAYPMTDVVLHKKALWFKSSEELIAHYPSVADVAGTYSGAVVMLPILVRQKAIGGVTFVFNTPQTFDQDERDLVVALTQQCAQSLERVQLYEEAQLAAATRERERLARDLHDAVSQALFSANIIAESLPRQWQRDPEKALEGLVQLHQLTRGAQAEMRTLLLELRPTAILEADLKSLLPQLVDAVRSRKRITIASEIEEPEQLPPDVKIGLYRIAQEALNNIAKHSRATEAFVRLTSHNGQVKLVISDNGKGFDLDRVVATSLGLKIMHERAQAVGASLKIASESGQGTQVTVVWSG